MQRIVATGRAFWLDHQRPPLRWGEPREGRVEWAQVSKHGVAPHLIVPGTIALNAEPPVYVDEATRTIGPVELNRPPRLACQFLSAPAIPRAQVAEVSRRLGQALPERHHGLLPGTPAPVVGIDEDPVLILRLQRGHVNTGGYYYGYRHEVDRPIGVAHLSFRYGPIEIETSERANWLEAFHAGQVYSIVRRPTKEKTARKRLSDFNFIGAMAAFPSLDRRHARDLTLKDPYDWFDFLNLHAAALQAQGFEIRVDDDFPFRLAPSSGEFDASSNPAASTGSNWRSVSKSTASGATSRRCWPHWSRHPTLPRTRSGSLPKRAIISICRSPTVVIFRLPPIASCHWCWRCMACGWAACSRMRQGRSSFRVRTSCRCWSLRTRNLPSAAPAIFAVSRVCSRPEI